MRSPSTLPGLPLRSVLAGLALAIAASATVPRALAVPPPVRRTAVVRRPVAPAPAHRCQTTVAPVPFQDPRWQVEPATFAPQAFASASDVWIFARTRDARLVRVHVPREGGARLEDRTVGAAVGDYSATRDGDGLAVVWVRHNAPGTMDDLVFARFGPTGEARNVPRVVGRGHTIDGVALQSVDGGFWLAWGNRGGNAPGTWIAPLDPRGGEGPQPPRLAGPGADPGLVPVPAADGPPGVLLVHGPGPSQSILLLQDLASQARALTTPPLLAGPVSDTPEAAWALGRLEPPPARPGATVPTPPSPELGPPGAWTLQRWNAAGVAGEIALEAHGLSLATVRPAALAPLHDGVAVLSQGQGADPARVLLAGADGGLVELGPVPLVAPTFARHAPPGSLLFVGLPARPRPNAPPPVHDALGLAVMLCAR